MLADAIDQKMEDQAEFVRWWAEKVRDRGKRANVSDQKLFVEQALGEMGAVRVANCRFQLLSTLLVSHRQESQENDRQHVLLVLGRPDRSPQVDSRFPELF